MPFRNIRREMRLVGANTALSFFAADTFLFIPQRKVVVSWVLKGVATSRTWMTRGQDFYPTWHKQWPHGGTCCVALSQLVRWVRDEPVLPLRCWEGWCGVGVMLAGNHGQELLRTLTRHAYPVLARCVLCDEPIRVRLDWWSKDGVTGPCCAWMTGCRQRPPA